MLIIRLYTVELIHVMLFFDSHVSGISIVVGKIIFNILVNLGYVHNQPRRC